VCNEVEKPDSSDCRPNSAGLAVAKAEPMPGCTIKGRAMVAGPAMEGKPLRLISDHQTEAKELTPQAVLKSAHRRHGRPRSKRKCHLTKLWLIA
jgi:hypothetical protein